MGLRKSVACEPTHTHLLEERLQVVRTVLSLLSKVHSVVALVGLVNQDDLFF